MLDSLTGRRRQTLFLLSQHQIGALVATAVDYVVMIACVSAFGLSPVAGTVLGSIAGAFVSFALGRGWIFDARRGSVVGQGLRYAIISGLSLCGNAAGEWLLVRAHVHYFVARVIASLVVGVCWNFPMHRHFVFKHDWDDAAAALHTPPAPPPSTDSASAAPDPASGCAAPAPDIAR
jgi:putative flippase GtrA